MLTRDPFHRTRCLALRLTAIELRERHRELLDRRSRRLAIDDGEAMDALPGAAEDGERAERRLIGLLTPNYTGFFRNPWHFDIAAEHAVRAAHARGLARLWSAAAATGAEPRKPS
jgi:chemotaxis protein methyltransferase CheR